MIERASLALAALLLGLIATSCMRSAMGHQETVASNVVDTVPKPLQTTKQPAQAKGEEKPNIVKYIDFTKPKNEQARAKPKNAQAPAKPKARDNDVAGHSSAVIEATSYTVRGKTYRTLDSRQLDTFHQQGRASWYGPGFNGRKTASGEIYDMNAMTAAHKSLPLGTKVKVTNLGNGKSVVVRINDRGPFYGNRILDLSKAAAGKIGSIEKGVADVSIVVLR